MDKIQCILVFMTVTTLQTITGQSISSKFVAEIIIS